ARPQSPDLVVVDGEAPGMELGLVVAAWARRNPSPAMLVLGTTAAVRAAAERVRARFLPKPVVPEELVEIASASLARGHSYPPPPASPVSRPRPPPGAGAPPWPPARARSPSPTCARACVRACTTTPAPPRSSIVSARGGR